MSGWLRAEAPTLAARVRAMQKEDEFVAFEGGWVLGENEHTYWNIAYFIPPGVSKDRVVLGAVAFDSSYLRKTFLPALMKDVLTSKNGVLMAERESTGHDDSPLQRPHPVGDVRKLGRS